MTDLLQIQPAGCTLTPAGMRDQRARFERVRPAVRTVEQSPGSVRVAFAPDVDAVALRELMETERECCSFLTIDYDEREHVLRIASDDSRRWDVVAGFAGVFAGAS